jgi:hypothetical protein
MKMEQTECSETSAYKIQTPGNYPEENIQHYSRLIAKSNNKIRTTRNTLNKETGKVHLVEQVPTLQVNDETLKDPTKVANAFNNFHITITEKLNIQQTIQYISTLHSADQSVNK